MLFINAALGSPAGDLFVHARWQGIPVMLMPYIGALKAWIYQPIFHWFGVSALTVRLPVLIIGAISIVLTYLYVSRLFNPLAGWLAACMMAVEPDFIFSTRWDWGPTALMMLFKAAFLLGVCEWLRRGHTWPLWLALAAATAGIYDKFNFIWVPISASVAMVIVYPGNIKFFFNRHRVVSWIVLGLIGALALFVLLYFIMFLSEASWVPVHEYPQRWDEVAGLLKLTLGGMGPFSFIFGNGEPLAAARVRLLAVAFVLAIAALMLHPSEKWQTVKGVAFITLMGLLVLLQLFLTRRATGPHHVAMLNPWWLVILAGLTATPCNERAQSTFRQTRHSAAVGCAFLAILLVVLGSLRVDVAYLKALERPVSNSNWDAGSYQLAEYVKQHPVRNYVYVDWGISNVILGLTQGKVPCHDLWPVFMRPVSPETAAWLEKDLTGANTVFVLHALGADNFNQTRQNFFALAEQRKWQTSLEITIPKRDGGALFELYKVKTPAHSTDETKASTQAVERDDAKISAVIAPRRGVFYSQPRAAHWWLWSNFNREIYLKDLKKMREAHIDTVTLELHFRDFIVHEQPGTALQMNQRAMDDLRFAVDRAHQEGLRVMFVLWYLMGYDASKSGGARLLDSAAFEVYRSATGEIAKLTEGHGVIFLFTNELFDFSATQDIATGNWRLAQFPLVNKAFVTYIQAVNPALSHWNQILGLNLKSWDEMTIAMAFPKQVYWNWQASLIRRRLPALVEAIKQANPLARVGYEDYIFTYGWGDSAVPKPCPLDFIGFGIYRDMLIATPERADEAYRKLAAAYPDTHIFIAEVGMDTADHTEAAQAQWYAEILDWARQRKVGVNILNWQDFQPREEILRKETSYGMLRIDGSPKPAFEVLQRLTPFAGELP